MTTAREAALAVLERCRREGAWAGQSLDAWLRSGELDAREAALAAQLSLGVLQNSRYLDHYIELFCTAPKLEPKLRDLLRLGAYQLLFLDKIPAHAAVDETVALCKKAGYARASGLVNAVLRRLSEHRAALPELPGRGTPAYLALRYSQQDWLAEELVKQNGYDFAEAFFAACQQPAMTDLQINTLKTSAAAYGTLLDDKGLRYELAPFPDCCLSVSGGKVSELPGYAEGLFYVQDRAAAMAVEIAGPKPEIRVLDACAAPGGKSFAAALRMQDRGEILACDIHEKKLQLVETGAQRLGISCLKTQTADARHPDPGWSRSFDLVIADVPCSGFGVMRKKPEIRFKKREETEQLPAIQGEILHALAGCVALGGTLLYSTCTVLRRENEAVVHDFLRSHTEFMFCDFTVDGRASEGGCYTFWPQIDGGDGFFAAKLIRKQG